MIIGLATATPVHAEFVPNFGEGVTMRGNSAADPSAPLLVHALRDAAAGLVIILPLSVAAAAAKKEGIKLHVSERFLRDKDSDPLGRPIPDYSHTACGTPPNHPDLKQVIAERWGDVTHPDISEVCDAYLNARATTPRGRVGIESRYTRCVYKDSAQTKGRPNACHSRR